MGGFLILPLLFHLISNQPTSALVPPTPTLGELQEWQDIAKVREDKIRELELLNQDLRHDNRILTVVFVFLFVRENLADPLNSKVFRRAMPSQDQKFTRHSLIGSLNSSIS